MPPRSKYYREPGTLCTATVLTTYARRLWSFWHESRSAESLFAALSNGVGIHAAKYRVPSRAVSGMVLANNQLLAGNIPADARPYPASAFAAGAAAAGDAAADCRWPGLDRSVVLEWPGGWLAVWLGSVAVVSGRLGAPGNHSAGCRPLDNCCAPAAFANSQVRNDLPQASWRKTSHCRQLRQDQHERAAA